MQVPRIEPKLRVFSFKIQFQAQVGKHLICICSSLHFIICPYPVKLLHSTMSFTGFWATEKSEYCKFSSGSGKYFSLLFVYLSFSWGEGGGKGGKVVTSMSWVQDLEAAIRGEKRASVGIKISLVSQKYSYQIRNSAKLKRIMQTILSLGNALNQGTARGVLTILLLCGC